MASVTKLFVAYAALIAWEEGTVGLDDPAGPPGSTVRHLLAHTAGFGFDTPRLAGSPGERRIYSNVGIEVFGEHLAARSGMAVGDYLAAAVIEPLGLLGTTFAGSPAHGLTTSVDDLMVFCRELLTPTLVSPSTLDMAVQEQFPGVAGVLPGFGHHDPNPWGLGFEIRGEKSPHWTGGANRPGTVGHFGGSGSFLWVDRELGLAACAISDTAFGPWAAQSWPPASDDILRRFT